MLRGKYLDVGGGARNVLRPAIFNEYELHILDIDPACNPDVLMDARELTKLEPNTYDAICCSHNLEHYFDHDVPKVLRGFLHILKDDGWAMILVPNMEELMQIVAAGHVDLADPLYHIEAGPICPLDVIYGWRKEIEESGVDFYAHRTGFSRRSLSRVLKSVGFKKIYTVFGHLEVISIAFKNEPTPEQIKHMQLQ